MRILYADGIGSARFSPNTGNSILEVTATRLSAALGAPMERVEWPASMAGVGGPMSWEEASRIGVEYIDDALARSAEPVLLLGYSGGCKVVHDWMDQAGLRISRVAAVGFVSDPFRPKGKGQYGTPDVPGFGICGPRTGPIPDRTFWAAWPGDVITDCPGDSPLRTLADLSDRIPGGFLDDFGGHLSLNDWQLANHIELWRRDPLAYLLNLPRRMREARWGVHGYLTGEHTTVYVEEWGPPTDRRSYAVRLADTINYGLGVRGYGRQA